ncbi:MAG: ParB/RepB/Spo0J family partition protein [Desulfobacteraceae bacterium]|nr:MAG: ParB/RepB/Spo0J family partition protein [Desulfobacteraceae bacterium]
MKKELIIKGVMSEDLKKENINNETALVKEGNMEKAKEIIGNGNGAAGMELNLVDINSISVSEHHPRKEFGDITSLKESIKRDGMFESLLVYKIKQGKYVVIDGARRLLAAKEMDIEQISCRIINDITEKGATHLSYVINSERKTLSVIEMALHWKTMRDTFGYTTRELETMGYGSHSSIANKLQLLDLPKELQGEIHSGILTAAHGLALCKLPSPEEQKNLATQIGKGNMSVKSTEEYVDRYLAKKDSSKEDKAKKSFIPDDDLPGVYFKGSRDMCEQPDNSVPLIVSNTIHFDNAQNSFGSLKNHLANIEGFAKEGVRVVGPGGIIVLITDYINYAGRDGSVIKLMGPIYQDFLQKNKAFLTDMIIWDVPSTLGIRYIRPNADDQPHTSYRINNNCVQIYIFRVNGKRETPSEEIISQSKLTKKQKMAWIGGNGLWKIGIEEMINRLIRMYSHVGDTVLDPFLGDGIMLKVAKELGRVGIGYEENIKNKPAIMETLGLIPEVTAVKSSKLMSDYVKQTMPSEENAVKSSESDAEVAEVETVN